MPIKSARRDNLVTLKEPELPELVDKPIYARNDESLDSNLSLADSIETAILEDGKPEGSQTKSGSKTVIIAHEDPIFDENIHVTTVTLDEFLGELIGERVLVLTSTQVALFESLIECSNHELTVAETISAGD